MSLFIAYVSEGFPPGGSVANGWATLATSWDKLLWAALTVGRPNVSYVFAFGPASVYEALFRLSLVRMTLEQAGATGTVFCVTEAAKSLDPTEKGAADYFIGMAVAKLFCSELLDAPWMLHLDVFGEQVNATTVPGRSRPDLIGQDTSGRWVSLESKGRMEPTGEKTKAKAKSQAELVETVDGVAPFLNIGAITFFRNGILEFFWRDPEVPRSRRISLQLPTNAWDHYYALVRGLMDAGDLTREDGIVWTTVEGADIQVGLQMEVWSALKEHGGAVAKELAGRLPKHDSWNADGILVRAGQSWLHPYSTVDTRRR
jgi:hypothetical protein